MRLRWWQRVVLGIVGIALLGAGGVGTAFDWSGVGLTALIVAGVFVLLGAVVGAMPRGSLKDGNVEWPEVDKHPRIEQLEAEISALRADAGKARDQAADAANLVIDWILAQDPGPDDGMTDQERREDLERGVARLEGERARRLLYSDEPYDITAMEVWRSGIRRELVREERRQAARKRFGLLLNEQQPAKRD